MATDPARERRALNVVEEALPLLEPERNARIAMRCGDDAELRARVECLLARQGRGDLEVTPDAALLEVFTSPTPAPETLTRIGPYRLAERIGEGGMGTVWLAHRADAEFEHEVAVKLIKRGMDTDAIVERFRRERQVLARLQHDGVARLLDGGSTVDGRPYLVMELVEGAPIDRHCAEHELGVTERLALFAEVCDAVEAAHAMGVVHRDLKPANILITAAGRPKLLDFGIAKLLEGDDSEDPTQLTVTGQRVLTPRYAAPEQVRGERILPTTDVFALGVVLYELMCGQSPYGSVTTTGRELESAICDERPPPPSRLAPREIRRRLAGDIDVIVMRALAKDPSRRYRSAGELADDVRRHLADRPIGARRDSFGYRAHTFVRRNRLLVGAIVTVFVALAAGLAVALLQYFESERLRGVSEGRREQAEWNAYAAQLEQAVSAFGTQRPMPLDEMASSLRGWEWHHLKARTNVGSVLYRGSGLGRVAMDAGGLTLAALEAGAIVVLDPNTGVVRNKLEIGHGIWDLALSPDGRHLAMGYPGGVRVVDIETTSVIFDRPGEGGGLCVCFSPDGTRLAVARDRGEAKVVLYSLADGAVLAELHAPTALFALAISPDGQRIAVGGSQGLLQILSANDLSIVHTLSIHSDRMRVNAVAFSPDGRLLAAQTTNGVHRVFDVHDGSPFTAPFDIGFATRVMAFLPQGDQLVLPGMVLSIRNLATGELRNLATGATRSITSLAVHPTAPRVFCTDSTRAAIYEVRTDEEPLPRHHISNTTTRCDAVLRPDGLHHAAQIGNREVVVHDTASGVRLAQLDVPPLPRSVAYHPDGREIVVTSDGGITVFDATTFVRTAHLPLAGARLGTFVADGSTFVCSAEGMNLVTCETRPWRIARNVHPELDTVRDIVACPDGRIALAGYRAKQSLVLLWSVLDGLPRLFCEAGVSQPSLAVSPDGHWLVIAHNGLGDPGLQVRNLDTGELVAQLAGVGASRAPLFTPDGSRLIVAHNGSPTVYETTRWRRAVQFFDGLRGIDSLSMSADGSVMVSGDREGDVRVWRATPR